MPASQLISEVNAGGVAERELLMEGLQDCYLPEVMYVQQGDKAFFFKGSVDESVTFGDTGAAIVESFEDFDLDTMTIDEGTTNERQTSHVKGGKWVVEGPYQRSDTKNANGRTYARSIWERLIGDENSSPMKALRARGMVGQLEHPRDGRGDGREGAVLHTDLKLQKDGVVWGVSELLDTPNGRILQEYTRKNIRWGMSSRGNGTVADNGTVSLTDFMLENFDAVMKPSTPGAYPKRKGKTNEGSVDEGVDEGKAKTVPDKHMEKIAKKTLRMPDAAVGVMGGPSKEEARANLKRLGYTTAQIKKMEEDNQSGTHAVVTESLRLAQTDVMQLDEESLSQLVSVIMPMFGTVEKAKDDGEIETDQADELQSWLSRKLGEVHDRSPLVPAGDVINQALTEAMGDDGNGEGNAAYERTVSTLQSQVEEAAEEADGLRESNETLTADLAEANEARVRETKAADQYQELLDEANDEIERLQGELDEAADLISGGSREEIVDGVTQAVADAIASNPEMARFESVMMKADDVAEVEQLVESVGGNVRQLDESETTATEAVTEDVVGVSSLPRNLPDVVSESAAGNKARAGSSSRGAKIAAKVVAVNTSK